VFFFGLVGLLLRLAQDNRSQSVVGDDVASILAKRVLKRWTDDDMMDVGGLMIQHRRLRPRKPRCSRGRGARTSYERATVPCHLSNICCM
jgi:hypothetical protein